VTTSTPQISFPEGYDPDALEKVRELRAKRKAEREERKKAKRAAERAERKAEQQPA
jgi:hypothetical protein